MNQALEQFPYPNRPVINVANSNPRKKGYKFLMLFGVLIIAVLIISVFVFFIYKQYQQKKVEDFVKEYIVKTLNFDGLDGQIETLKTKIEYSDGFAKRAWEDGLFMKEKARDFSSRMLSVATLFLQDKNAEAVKEYFGEDFYEYISGKANSIKEMQTNVHQKVSDIKIKTLEKNKNYAKIQTDYSRYIKDFNGEETKNIETTYILNLINGNWKIVDVIDETGVWSETMDLEKIKNEFMDSLNEQEKTFDLIETGIKAFNLENNLKESAVMISKETFETGSEWNGQNSQIISLSSSNYAPRISAFPKSDGYLFKKITIPENAQYLTFDFKNEKSVRESYFTVSFGDRVIYYKGLSITGDSLETIIPIYIGDIAGENDQFLFAVNQLGNELPSIVIDNVTFYK